MGLTADIRTALSGIAASFADGIVEIRSIASNSNAVPRTFGSWQQIPDARCVEFNESKVFDEPTHSWVREETCQLRVPYLSDVQVSIRDQIRISGGLGSGPGADPSAEQVWSVHHQLASAAGSVSSYQLVRRTPYVQNSRKGGD